MRDVTEGELVVDVDAIRECLDAASVTLAVLYGSHARGEAGATSDVDIAVAFEPTLQSTERTRERLSLIEQLSATLETDEVDIVPLPETSPTLRREICTDGIVLLGTQSDLETYCEEQPRERTHEERLAEFDRLLADIERVV